MSTFHPTSNTTLKRLPQRGAFDRATVYSILDEAFICHVGFAVDGQPFVIPTQESRVALEMKTKCERCEGFWGLRAEAFICTYECTFCPACAAAL